MIDITIKAETPVHAAIIAVGGPGKLAKGLSVSVETIRKYRNRGWFPDHHLKAVEQLSGLPYELISQKPEGAWQSAS